MTDAERIDFMQGQIIALRSMCFALMATHGNLPQLVNAMERFAELQIGVTLGQAASEATLEGAANMRETLHRHASGMLEMLAAQSK